MTLAIVYGNIFWEWGKVRQVAEKGLICGPLVGLLYTVLNQAGFPRDQSQSEGQWPNQANFLLNSRLLLWCYSRDISTPTQSVVIVANQVIMFAYGCDIIIAIYGNQTSDTSLTSSQFSVMLMVKAYILPIVSTHKILTCIILRIVSA